jgi:hypothetical protein
MAIMVQYKDNSFGNVRNEALDSLIDGNAVVAFRRKSGWVEIGRDPLRGGGVPREYAGEDRRSVAAGKTCLTCADFVDSLCRTNSCSLRLSLQGKTF